MSYHILAVAILINTHYSNLQRNAVVSLLIRLCLIFCFIPKQSFSLNQKECKFLKKTIQKRNFLKICFFAILLHTFSLKNPPHIIKLTSFKSICCSNKTQVFLFKVKGKIKSDLPGFK